MVTLITLSFLLLFHSILNFLWTLRMSSHLRSHQLPVSPYSLTATSDVATSKVPVCNLLLIWKTRQLSHTCDESCRLSVLSALLLWSVKPLIIKSYSLWLSASVYLKWSFDRVIFSSAVFISLCHFSSLSVYQDQQRTASFLTDSSFVLSEQTANWIINNEDFG